jgi:Tfp pilus assembly protein PilN
MIRINLAKTQSYVSAGTQPTSTMDLTKIGLAGNGDVVAKVVGLLLFTIALIVYEKYNLSIVKTQLNRISVQVQEVEQEISEYGAVESAIENLTKEKEKVNEQLAVIQKISQKRAFKLQAIIKVQSSLPDDLWLKELLVADNRLSFIGYSRSPSSVQAIVKGLTDMDIVQSAINKELSRVKLGDETLQKFEIEAEVVQ